MRKSVSRVIDRDNGNLTAKVGGGQESIGVWEIENAFGKVPKTKYKVTYTLNQKGKYKVGEQDNFDMYLDHPGKHSGGMAICWLPREWAGERVNRKVEILSKKKVKK
jgi:hypothetical protein